MKKIIPDMHVITQAIAWQELEKTLRRVIRSKKVELTQKEIAEDVLELMKVIGDALTETPRKTRKSKLSTNNTSSL